MLFEYLKLLNADLLQRLHELSQQVHAQVIAKRKSGVTEETQNVFMNGELVLLQKDPDKTYPKKLSLPFTGPYEVIQQDPMVPMKTPSRPPVKTLTKPNSPPYSVQAEFSKMGINFGWSN